MIEAQGVRKVFPANSDGERVALDGVDLRLSDGEWCCVVGPNGSGKTTLLRVLAGECAPSSGKVLLDGQDITDWPQALRAGFCQYIEQDTSANLVESMSIEENLAIATVSGRRPRLRFATTTAVRERIQLALQRVGLGLENRLRTQVRFLSGGERQALLIAKVLMSRARVLLLDEFLAAIDPRTGPLLLEMTRQLAKELGLSVLLVSHDLDVITRSGGRVVFLEKGKIVAELAQEESGDRSKVLELYGRCLAESARL